MNAGHIVNALIETGEDLTPEEFMEFFGKRRLGGFHFAPASEYSGKYRTTRGALLVYTNNGNGTRDFIGVIRPLSMSPGWIPLAIASPRQRTAELISLYAGKSVPTRGEAADQVLDAYEKNEADKKRPQQEAEELGGDVDPGEFLDANPDLLAHYTFDPTADAGQYYVDRLQGDKRLHVGTVLHSPVRDGWRAYLMAPVGKFRAYTSLPAIIRSNRHEAAEDLWGHYNAARHTT